MSTDAELLERYARERAESSFTELVERHINVVYGAALRETQGDTSLAQDVTQAVFVEAARKAAALARHPAFAGWLYTSVRYTAANLRRAEQRRRHREQEAYSMSEMNSPTADTAAWEQLRPVIDDVVHELNETDRAVVVLRFFEGRSFKEVGDALKLNENAARMRADRALDKLRLSLNKRGVASTGAGVAAAIAVGATVSAPSGLAATVATAAVAGSVASTSATTLTWLKIMSLTKLQLAAVSALVVTAVGVPVWQQTRLNAAAARNKELEAQVAAIPALRQQVAQLTQLHQSKEPKVDPAELDRLRAAQSEVLKLRAKAHSGMEAQAEANQLRADLAREKANAGATNPFSDAMGGVMKGYMEQMVTGKINKMKEKLNLTPDQEQAIRDILLKQADAQVEATQKVMSGKMTREDFAQAKTSGGDPEKQIQALLTPDQQAAYQEYKKEDAIANARLAANAEMLQMQNALGLSQEQQDKVYGVLYDQYVNALSRQPAVDPPPTNSDPVAAMQGQLDKKLKALEGVLSPTQLDSYRQLQQAQMKMLQGFLPQSGKASQPQQTSAGQ